MQTLPISHVMDGTEIIVTHSQAQFNDRLQVRVYFPATLAVTIESTLFAHRLTEQMRCCTFNNFKEAYDFTQLLAAMSLLVIRKW